MSTVVHLPVKPSMLESLTGGGDSAPDDPVAAAVRLMIYRETRTQIRETSHFLQHGGAGVVR